MKSSTAVAFVGGIPPEVAGNSGFVEGIPPEVAGNSGFVGGIPPEVSGNSGFVESIPPDIFGFAVRYPGESLRYRVPSGRYQGGKLVLEVVLGGTPRVAQPRSACVPIPRRG